MEVCAVHSSVRVFSVRVFSVRSYEGISTVLGIREIQTLLYKVHEVERKGGNFKRDGTA